ncbi:phosphoribosylformylglycinamidine cyclo-ligase [Tepidibacter thalassicus]|uniref:Phosphoribosylformylglycinamidine cyclo-ligase n=1 Tax=Tepidibacter thalassicus DSM 15285 TaxID=1123350 RepID=A0A1M5SS85_9FIRM|nr:phosphoribosylformylglycinamidine cyclo-ligase [Tepidibacter thalassicus]SHH41365.1 phosphoribosylformylglycinamidine cyclo-ligase [Tepidibacter thalassicus DSM 15285]
MGTITYKQSGVDIDEGNRAVNLIKQKVKSTYNKNVIGDLGNFSGIYSLKGFLNMKEPVLLSSTDGVGTKLKIAQIMGIHNTVGIDLVAMCVNDLICQGAKPLFFLDYIATGKLKAEKIDDIISGIVKGCSDAQVALIGGETAEMPGMYDEEEYDLAGFSVGICDKEKIITGDLIREGDILIGISSSGVHSNGYSLIRKMFLEKLNWNLNKYIDEFGKTLGETLLTPTKIYVSLVMDLLHKYNIKGIANITGGGLIENIPRIIPENLGVKINKNSWDELDVFKVIRDLDLVEESDLYRSFNMGIGIVLVVDKEDVDEILRFICMKDKAYIIGEVINNKGVILC